MGILAEPVAMLRDLKLPKGFAVCELGDQWVTCEEPHRLASELYREMGARRYDAIDMNGRGTILFDLNRKWHGKTGEFDLVTDFGTGEHIFNQAEVWRTMHLLAKREGYLVFDRPSQGYKAHALYLVDEGLFHDLAKANRYRIVRLEHGTTSRGELIRGVFQKTGETKFTAPQQGRYVRSMVRC